MDTEIGVLLVNCVLSLTAIIKVLVSQNSSKKTNDSLEAELKVLKAEIKALKEQSDSDIKAFRERYEVELTVFKERISRLDTLDEKFDKVTETLVEVKTQLGMLLNLNNIKTKPT
jgi:hypothetical protein